MYHTVTTLQSATFVFLSLCDIGVQLLVVCFRHTNTWEHLNPGQLAMTTSALPLSYNGHSNATLTLSSCGNNKLSTQYKLRVTGASGWGSLKPFLVKFYRILKWTVSINPSPREMPCLQHYSLCGFILWITYGRLLTASLDALNYQICQLKDRFDNPFYH